MKKPRISVCCVTTRPGGIDVLLAGLKNQEFDRSDFEVILVDAHFHRRREIVADYFAQAQITLRHVPPRLQNFPLDSVPQYRNTAIAKASGELLVWLVDYSYVPKAGLKTHWDVYEQHGKEVAGMGAHRYVLPPPLVFDLPWYAPMAMFPPNAQTGVTYGYDRKASDAYADDILAGRYDSCMYSIFTDPLEKHDSIESLKDDPYFFHADPKLTGHVHGKMFGSFFHAKNESVPLDWAIRVNGFDEAYIAHSYDDVDFGVRVEHLGGMWSLLGPEAHVQIVNPRHIFPHGVRQVEDPNFQRSLYETRKDDTTIVRSLHPSYDVAEMRQMGTWWY